MSIILEGYSVGCTALRFEVDQCTSDIMISPSNAKEGTVWLSVGSNQVEIYLEDLIGAASRVKSEWVNGET